MNTKPAARKTHRKTRTGCRTCKSRKIKCDEQKPACHNCIKHCVQCDFLTIQSIASGPGRLTDTASDSPQASGSILNFNSDPRNTLSAQNNVPLQGLNLTDLELLHNYVTSTAFTLHSDPTMQTIWRINVAQVGFSYDFVMRGMLALSALHLARHRPEKKELYLRQAMLQHQAGLRETTNLLRSMTPDNATAIYIFSAHTLYFTLASPRKSGDFLLVGENGIADWLFLVKGTSFIVETFHETLINGPVGPIFLAGMRRTATREQYLAKEPEAGDPLDELSSLITQASSSISPAHTQIYVKAIDDLRKSFVFCYKQGPSGYETTDIFHWVFRVGNDYLELMRQQTQESLAVFAYFCVVLKRLDNHWWIEGWATHLIAKIWNLLDEEHRLWIRWPVEEIGWIP